MHRLTITTHGAWIHVSRALINKASFDKRGPYVIANKHSRCLKGDSRAESTTDLTEPRRTV